MTGMKMAAEMSMVVKLTRGEATRMLTGGGELDVLVDRDEAGKKTTCPTPSFLQGGPLAS